MKAMILEGQAPVASTPLAPREIPVPAPGPGKSSCAYGLAGSAARTCT